MSIVRIYIPPYNYKNWRIFEIFQFSQDGKIEVAPLAKDYFYLENNPHNADWILIPVFITFLLNEEGRNLILQTSKLAEIHKKPFGVFSNSDFIVDVEVSNAFVFTPGAYRSKPNQIDLPATLPEDPYLKWIGLKWEPITDFSQPSIGFCGQATTHPLKALKDLFTFTKTSCKNKLGQTFSNPGPIFLPAFQRARLLQYFEKDLRFKSDFILRNQYKGGATNPAQNLEVEDSFYKNINNNLFTVCLRGMGNYSVRFFQTLAMGRIPIVLETDNSITFQEFNKLHLLIPVIPFEKKEQIPSIVFEYFESKAPEELIFIQRRCREIWLEYYQKEGMLKYIGKIMLEKTHLPIWI